MNRVVQRNEIVKRSTALIVFASDRCLCQVAMAVAGRIVALTIKPHVLGIGKRRRMQSMRRVKRYLQPQENRVVFPCFSKEIGPLVQTNPIQWHHRFDAFVDVFGQALRG
jgi:hypothetical protein